MRSSLSNQWQENEISPQVRLSALWATVTLLYLYGDYFELYVPHKTQGLVESNHLLDSPLKLFLAAVLLSIPALMVFLCIVLKPSISQILNIIIGLFFTIIMLLIAVTNITAWRAFYVFYALLESTLTTMVVMYAWRWLKTAKTILK
ncbi:MAG: DUF6326 family protein [Spirosomataceae bacterium]